MRPETSDKEDKSLKDKLKSDVSKTIARALSGEGLHFNRIKINENLLKKNILKVIKQLNRDPLNVTFHASAGHITIIRSITKNYTASKVKLWVV